MSGCSSPCELLLQWTSATAAMRTFLGDGIETPLRSDQLFVDALVAVGHGGLREAPLRLGTADGAVDLVQPADGRGHLLLVVADEAGHAVFDHLGDAAVA